MCLVIGFHITFVLPSGDVIEILPAGWFQHSWTAASTLSDKIVLKNVQPLLSPHSDMVTAGRSLFCLFLGPQFTKLLLVVWSLGACELKLWLHCIPSCLHRNLACGKGLSSTRAFPEVRITGSNFTVFQMLFFVVFITSLKDPCSLFGLTEPEPAWNLWRDTFWPCCSSGGAGIHSGTCLKAAMGLSLDRGASESWHFTGSSCTFDSSPDRSVWLCVTAIELEIMEVTLRQ